MIPVSRPETFSTLSVAATLSSVMDSAWFTNDGPMLRQFEARVEKHLAVPHLVAMANGTLALEAAETALFQKGSAIAIPSFTFVAVASSLVRSGYRPVFVDIEPDYWTMDYDAFMDVFPSVSGFVVPTVFGVLPNAQFSETNVPGILDNAEGFGTVRGLFCTLDVYSFHATKVVTAGEGGGVACQCPTSEVLKRWRNFGFEVESSRPSIIGTNAKLSEFHAAIGMLSLKRCRYQVQERTRLMDIYRQELGNKVQFQKGDTYNCVILVEDKDRIASKLEEQGVDTRPYFYPIHKMPAYQQFADKPLPVTERIASQSLALPLWAGLTESTVVDICRMIGEEL